MATTYTVTLTDGDDTFADVPNRSTLILGLLGNDTLYGKDGDDVIYGEGASISLLGGNDTLYGGAGNDRLSGGQGSDVMYGGLGDDRFSADENLMDVAVVDKYYGGEGNDFFGTWYSFSSGTEAIFYGGVGDDTYNLSGIDGYKIIEKAGEGIDTIILNVGGSVTLPDNVENVTVGLDGPATVTGNALDNVMSGGLEALIFYGLGGNDTLTGYRRADQLYGGSGNDTLEGGSDEDILDGGTGDDILKGASNEYVTYSGLDIDQLIGGKGNDIYYADTSDKIIENKNEGLDTLFAVPRSNLTTDFYDPTT